MINIQIYLIMFNIASGKKEILQIFVAIKTFKSWKMIFLPLKMLRM